MSGHGANPDLFHGPCADVSSAGNGEDGSDARPHQQMPVEAGQDIWSIAGAFKSVSISCMNIPACVSRLILKAPRKGRFSFVSGLAALAALLLTL